MASAFGSPIKLSLRINVLNLTLASLLLVCGAASAQVNVLTAHNDIARTGQNLNETILTPGNVNPSQFGKLFSQTVNGEILAQPLYVSQVAIPNKGTHNVVYVATGGVGGQGDSVYAFDADSNGGNNGAPLWQVSLLTNTTPAGTYTVDSGVWGTPVIDLNTKTMYLVSNELQNGTDIFRLHALDITTGAEKFGAPMQIRATVAGNGADSSNGVLNFDPTYQKQRAALLFLNGVLYIGFGSNNDEGPWHGWLFSYIPNTSANTLNQQSFFCTTPNGTEGGIWMAGAGLAAEVYNTAKPYGRLFVSTANGTYSNTAPNSYAMTVLDFDLTGGNLTLKDQFTPFNQAALTGQDGDLGSGGPILLPTQTLASGKKLNPLLEIGKSGMFYILDRDNNADGSNNANTEYSPAGLGGYNTNGDQVVQEVQTPIYSGINWGAGVWGGQSYWNGNIYSGGINVTNTNDYTGNSSNVTAYSFVNGVLSKTPTSKSTEQYYYPSPQPVVSANGNNNAIVWAVMTYPEATNGPETLLAYNATNLGNTLYSSATNQNRDNPGVALKYIVPTIANGKVYVGAGGQVSIYGLLNLQTTPAPSFNPGTETFVTSPAIVMTDSLAGATIYYTIDGSTPTTNSAVYNPQSPPYATTNETVSAIASANGYLQSAVTTAVYTSSVLPTNPVFSLAAGTYTGPQTLTISESTGGAVVYYTIDGSTPTTASAVYSNPLQISTSEVVQAVAIKASGSSADVSASYTIPPAGTINFVNGFSLADGPMQFNGSTDLDDFRLQLTNGGANQAGSAFYTTPVNIQQFSTQFTFQLSNPSADGMTFTIQNASPTALGGVGGGLGYSGIPHSIAIKFDLYSNAGEGGDSTGLYTNGATPTLPSIDLSNTGINLHSGDYMDVSLTYNGTTLNMTITDAITLASWSNSWTINIPATVGSNTAYIGFTAGTGGLSSSQKVTYWLYTPGPPLPNYGSGFIPGSMTLNNGAAYNGTTLELTDGGQSENRNAFFNFPVNIQQFSTSFQFQQTNPAANGFTFTIQGNGPTPPGAGGSLGGGLGYTGIPKSVAIKFDLYNSAGEGPDSTGMYTNGAAPTVPATNLSTTGINLHSGDIFNVLMTYNGTTLTVIITDTVTNATATQTYTVNIPALVGGSTAYVGFTGSTGGATSIQQILSWTFNPLSQAGTGSGGTATDPAYTGGFTSAAQLSLNGGAALNGTALQLTDGGLNETRSAFFTTPVKVSEFSTTFNFQLTNASADGFTFTIQGNGPTVIGSGGGGGGLGYAGMGNSVAVKFDIFSNSGEGPDSTGIYTDGAGPAIPSTNLSTTAINLHSGDPFKAQLTYNGTTLTVVITDTATKGTATQTYTVNIPGMVGGTNAYVGFTAASGGLGAVQQILNWTYSN